MTPVAREVARWAWIQGHGDASKPPRLAGQYQPAAESRDSWKPPPRDWLARRLLDLPAFTTPAVVVRGKVRGER